MEYSGFVHTLISILLLVTNVELSHDEDASEFSLLASEQDRVCYASATCYPGRADSAESPCCGTCTCDRECAKYGLCCLGSYDNFSHAQDSTRSARLDK